MLFRLRFFGLFKTGYGMRDAEVLPETFQLKKGVRVARAVLHAGDQS